MNNTQFEEAHNLLAIAEAENWPEWPEYPPGYEPKEIHRASFQTEDDIN